MIDLDDFRRQIGLDEQGGEPVHHLRVDDLIEGLDQLALDHRFGASVVAVEGLMTSHFSPYLKQALVRFLGRIDSISDLVLQELPAVQLFPDVEATTFRELVFLALLMEGASLDDLLGWLGKNASGDFSAVVRHLFSLRTLLEEHERLVAIPVAPEQSRGVSVSWPDRKAPLRMFDMVSVLSCVALQLFSISFRGVDSIPSWEGVSPVGKMGAHPDLFSRWLAMGQQGTLPIGLCMLDVVFAIGLHIGMEQGRRAVWAGSDAKNVNHQLRMCGMSQRARERKVFRDCLQNVRRLLARLRFGGGVQQLDASEADVLRWPSRELPASMKQLVEMMVSFFESMYDYELLERSEQVKWWGPDLPSDMPFSLGSKRFFFVSSRAQVDKRDVLALLMEVGLYLGMEQARRMIITYHGGVMVRLLDKVEELAWGKQKRLSAQLLQTALQTWDTFREIG
jgi:hypothetical protein